MPDLPIVVVGAGVGGLAAALRLAHAGERVIVLEKTGQVGGRNRRVSVNRCQFDGGPTLMMMLDPFRKLFEDVGERIEDHLELQLCDPSYRVFFADGERIEGSPNVARMVEQIIRMSGRADSLGYVKMLGDLAAMYREAIPNFVDRNYNSPLDLVRVRAMGMALRHRMLGNLAQGVGRYVNDPRLRMMFSFQSMYLGLSPLDAPWVYAVLTYMEYGEGIWYPKGGMVRIGEAIAELAQGRGVEIRLNSPVARVDGDRVILESGEVLQADRIVINADLPYAERELLHASPRRAEKRRYSCSAFMMYVDYRGSLPELLHHNVFFGADFQGNLDAIFKRMEIPSGDPAFYAAVTARSDPDKAPDGHENLYVLVPCPNLDRNWSDHDACAIQEAVWTRLEREIGLDRDRIAGIRTYGPQDWADELNLDRGAAFGLSHDFRQSAAFRPSNRCRSNPRVTFVGASTVPGNGLPMTLISADLAVQRVLSPR